MTKRMIIMLVLAGLVFGGIFGFQTLTDQSEKRDLSNERIIATTMWHDENTVQKYLRNQARQTLGPDEFSGFKNNPIRRMIPVRQEICKKLNIGFFCRKITAAPTGVIMNASILECRIV